MKTIKITYWVVTIAFAAMMTFSGVLYLTSEEMKQGFAQMGFPSFFRVELGIAKIIGSIALLAPIPARMREWVYAGFTINLISALIAHISLGHPSTVIVMPALFLVGLAVSYATVKKRNEQSNLATNPT